ncbi:MAG: Flp pilus assembly complex ATPase component TadA [Planctomycetaceae bacterium]|nr:Flp pilus assembly complex ATPase component TadA [Planctomycetaceae bacterium]
MTDVATLDNATAPEHLPLAEVAGAAILSAEPAQHPGTGRLGEELLRAGLISEEQLEEALRRQSALGMRLGAALVELGFVTEEDIFPFVAQRLGVPCVQLRDGLVDPIAARLLPRDKSETLDALALFKVRGTLCIAMADPLNLRSTDTIERITGLKVRPVVAHAKSIQRMIQRVYDENFHVDAVTADMEESAVEISEDAIQIDLHTLSESGESSPIVNLVNFLIMQSLRHKASDIHIEPGRRHTTVRFRVDGQLREVLRPRRDLHPALISRIKVIAKMDIAEHRLPQDGRVHVVVDRREIDLRVSVLPTVLGEKAVIRVLDRQRLTFDLDKLGFSEQVLPQFKRLLAKPHGLLLVTGPTGSGKTTTLYSAIELIKSIHTNIITVEDPVEYQLELINQVMVDEGTTLTFPKALRSILRQDPDVVMVGEIRDPETANVAVQAALTGHLVLSTLHTNDSSGAVVRLLDMGVASYKVAAALIGVLAQRLLRGVCPECKTTHYPPRELLDAIGYRGDRRRSFVRGQGCSRCHDTGCQGRRGIYELLTCDGEMRRLIAQEASLETMRNHLKTQKMPNLFDQAVELAEAGETSLDEAIRVSFFE